ncbi:MAG: hypothetical protein ACJATV_000754 [Granulosicoccus sp.]|jgi:hypothetical protein
MSTTVIFQAIATSFLTSFLLFSTFSQAEPIKLDGYGIYVKSESGYERAKTYKHLRVDFEYLSELPVIKRAPGGLDMIVYRPEINIDAMAFDMRPIINPGARTSLTPIYKKLSEEQYSVKFEEDVPHSSIVIASVSWGNNALYSAVFSQPLASIISYYGGNDVVEAATTAVWSIEKSLKSYPKNNDLVALQKKWEGKVVEQKAEEQYEFIKEAWDKYEQASSTDTKLANLKQVKARAKFYFENFPDGKKTAQVKKMHKRATKKLDI